MKPSWRRIGLAVLLVAIVFTLLTGFFWTFVRDWIAIPIYFLVWVSDLILKSFPQQLYLALLILICVVIGIDALRLIRFAPNPDSAEPLSSPSRSRYAHWRMLCSYAQTSPYSREKFLEESRKLILSVLADQYALDMDEAQTRVEDSTIAVPEAIRKLIGQQRIHAFDPTWRMPRRAALPFWQRLFRQQEAPQLDSQAVVITDFVEQLLELNNAERQAEYQPDPQR